jgi:CRP-like cAMP-binding protein
MFLSAHSTRGSAPALPPAPDTSTLRQLSLLFFPRTFQPGETLVSAVAKDSCVVLIMSGSARETAGLGRTFGPGDLLDRGGVSPDGANVSGVIAETVVCTRILTRVGLERLQVLQPRRWPLLLPALVAHLRRESEA